VKPDRTYQEKGGYQYKLSSTREANHYCYDFTVSNLQMVTPPNRSGLTQGFNLFKLWFAEAPESGVTTDYGVWRASCFWTQYSPPSVRVPAGPAVDDLNDGDFGRPSDIANSDDYESNCLGIPPSRAQ
jgi:hypothetical protein